MTEPNTEIETTETEAVEVVDTPTEAEPEAFSRVYVEKLREEAARYRQRAKDRDNLAQELFYSRVAGLGLLADPTDLAYSDDLLADLPAMTTAVEELLSRKPHLAARTPHGDIGQGSLGGSSDVDLAGLLRKAAG